GRAVLHCGRDERADGIDCILRADKMRGAAIRTSRKVREKPRDPSDVAFQKVPTLLMETD
ncbi:uncharacterized, partial [Tachysurus ichikawai]